MHYEDNHSLNNRQAAHILCNAVCWVLDIQRQTLTVVKIVFVHLRIGYN